MKETYKCKACGIQLAEANENKYNFCTNCGSVNLISQNSAEHDNKVYFDAFYSSKDTHILKHRQYLFSKFLRLYNLLHKKDIEQNHLMSQKVEETILKAEKGIEIGFGSGTELSKLLDRGANLFGLDLSCEAVNNFKIKYPKYSDRVFCGTSFDFTVNLVYSNALFEHLDDPDDFLVNARKMLTQDGTLILKLPLVNKVVHDMKKRNIENINFWNPCHRVLYTAEGLNSLLHRNGFSIYEQSSFKYYGFKVMNLMLKLGYKEIEYIRNPYFKIKGLDSELSYFLILMRSMFSHDICSDSIIFAKKI